MWGGQKRAKALQARRLDAALARAICPPISRTRHVEAAARLAIARAKEIILIMPDGTEMPFKAGTIHMDDLRAESGYAIVVAGLDRFGWPVGHPDSPRSIQPPPDPR